VRTTEGLADAVARLREIRRDVECEFAATTLNTQLVELRSLIETALLVVRCARARRESRGLHFNADHAYRDNEQFLRDTVLRAGGS
jgi:L-aspartate oxidase